MIKFDKQGAKLKILLTSAGVTTALNVFFSIKNSTQHHESDIYAVSSDENCALACLAKEFIKSVEITNADYIPSILELCIKEGIDLVVPIHSKELLLFSENRKEFLKNGIKVLCSNFDSVKKFANKKALETFALANKFPIITSLKDENYFKYPIYCKPVEGSSARGHALLYNQQDYQNIISKSEINELIFQEYINADEITVDAYRSYLTGETFSIPRWRLRIQDGKATTTRSFYNKNIVDLTSRILEKADYYGPSNLQFFKKEERITLIEVNARMSAGGLPLAVECGLNIPEIGIDELVYGKKAVRKELKYDITMHRYLTEIFV